MDVKKFITSRKNINQKKVYNILKSSNLVDYTYTNFSRKYRNNNLSAPELIYIAAIVDLDLNEARDIIKEKYFKNKNSKSQSMVMKYKKFLLELYEEMFDKSIGKENPKIGFLEKNYEQFFIIKEDNKGILITLKGDILKPIIIEENLINAVKSKNISVEEEGMDSLTIIAETLLDEYQTLAFLQLDKEIPYEYNISQKKRF